MFVWDGRRENCGRDAQRTVGIKRLLRNVFEKEWENNWEIRRVRVLPYRRRGFAWDGREKRQIGFGI